MCTMFNVVLSIAHLFVKFLVVFTVMTIRDLIDYSFTSLPIEFLFCFHETISFTRHEIISIESSESSRF